MHDYALDALRADRETILKIGAVRISATGAAGRTFQVGPGDPVAEVSSTALAGALDHPEGRLGGAGRDGLRRRAAAVPRGPAEGLLTGGSALDLGSGRVAGRGPAAGHPGRSGPVRLRQR